MMAADAGDVAAAREGFERAQRLTPDDPDVALLEVTTLLGSGQRNRFVPAPWLRPLVLQNRGLETMDTAAACRTYNVLASEGRHVLAALLLESAS